MTKSEPFKRERSRVWWSLPFGVVAGLRAAGGVRSWEDELIVLVASAAILLSVMLAGRVTRSRRLSHAAQTFGEQAAYFQVLQENRTLGSLLYIGTDRIMLVRGHDIQRQWPRQSLVHASVISVRTGLRSQNALSLTFGRHATHEQVHLLFPGYGGFGSNRNEAKDAIAAIERHPPKSTSGHEPASHL